MSPTQWKRAHHHSLRSGQRITLVVCVLTLLLAAFPPPPASARPAQPVATETKRIPLNQLGATADQQLTDQQPGIRPTATGAAVQAILQDLAGDVTPQGLWLHSTAEDESDSQPFRIKAAALGRGETVAQSFAENGTVQVSGDLARWLRPGVVEEYSTSTDGVRQDFLLSERPAGNEPLRLELAVTGAQVMPTQGADNSVTLLLTGSGRQLVYHQLQVTDADGRSVPAKMSAITPERITLLVEDQNARWPLRIDPTFSDADWSALGSDINGEVRALAVMGSDLYVGGNFTAAGGVSASRVAKWNGNGWSALGSGVTGMVLALAVIGGDLYVGGSFATAGGVAGTSNIARWNGFSWSSLGSGTSAAVHALAVIGSDLYVGGGFTSAGGGSAIGIARWNGSSWSSLGTTGSVLVLALAAIGNDLYVGGFFSSVGGVPGTSNIARWNGSSWSPLGFGVGNAVYALAVSGSVLYVGGFFTTVGGVNINRIASWNGNSWSALGSGTSSAVKALAVIGSDLYVGGEFITAGGASVNKIAKWNGSSWSALGSGTSGTVNALAVIGSDLYVGGFFGAAGGVNANHIARWGGNHWSTLGTGTDASFSPVVVAALAVMGSDLYVGGGFTSAGGVSANNIAKWNGHSWSALGAGVNNTVWALAVIDSDLYVGGNFTSAGGMSINHIAKWDSIFNSWSSLGVGVNGSVFALAVSGNDLYVGGQFTMAGGVSANHIAQWNGLFVSWFPLGLAANNGVNGDVYALALRGLDLYVGGPFTMAGGVSANYIAQWSGSSWSTLGSGMDAAVWALAVSGSNLYAGGQFTTAGGASANRIAKWDGWAWSPLGAGVNNTVAALALNGIDLYVGGQFTLADGASANRIAKWDGTSWSGLGSGTNDAVSALLVRTGDLYVGGYFTRAGGLVAHRIAKARIGSPVGARITIRLDSQPDNEHNSKFTTTALGTFYLDDINNTKDAYTRTKSFVVSAGSYTFTETPPSGWHVDSIVCSNGASTLTARSITVTVADGDNITCTFTDKRTATLTVIAFNDRNGNGVKNASEPTQDGWTMQLGATGVPTITKITASANVTQTGRAVFTNLKPGLYRLCEVAQAGWTITRPTPATAGYPCYQSVTLTAGVGVVYSFGNRAATVAAAATDDALSATDGPVLSYDLPATDDDGNEIGEAMPLLSLDAETPIAPALPVASDQLSFSTFLPLVVAGRDSTLAEDVPVTQEVLHLGAETNSGDTENAGTIDLLPTQEERQDSAAPTSTTGADGSLPAHTLFLPLVTQ